MAQSIILTLDAGTTGVKWRRPSTVRRSAVQLRGGLSDVFSPAGWAQQKPQEQLDAVLRAIRQTLTHVQAADVAALVFTGTMNGCIPIDRDGNALHDNIIHSGRAHSAAGSRTGKAYSAGGLLPPHGATVSMCIRVCLSICG